MKRPSFQFYPADWSGNAKLKRCTHAERGIWIAVLCLMHDSEDEYGVLRWPLLEIANAAGCKLADLLGLSGKKVLKGADTGATCAPYVYTPRHAGKDGEPVILVPEQVGPIWYSSRMVTDEYVRTKRGENTRFGEGKEPPNGTPKVGKGDGASSSSPSSTTKPKITPGEISPTPNDTPRGTKLPHHWWPSEDLTEWAKREKPGLDIQQATIKFRNHYSSLVGSMALRSDWDPVFRNWVLNEHVQASDQPIDYAKITGSAA